MFEFAPNQAMSFRHLSQEIAFVSKLVSAGDICFMGRLRSGPQGVEMRLSSEMLCDATRRLLHFYSLPEWWDRKRLVIFADLGSF